MDANTYATVMTAERVLVGAAALIAPGPLLASFGVDLEFNTPAVRYTTRLMGVRNIALGVQLRRSTGDVQEVRQQAGMNAAVELVDLVSGLAVTARHSQFRRAGVAVCALSLAVATAFLGLRAAASGE